MSYAFGHKYGIEHQQHGRDAEHSTAAREGAARPRKSLDYRHGVP
jgi:hypothetical protein